jgi:hypothetical protein
MLTLVAIALLLGGFVMFGRWWLNRVDGIGRKVALPWSAWMLPALGCLALIPVVRHHSEETRLSRIASSLAGVKATVHCQSGTAEWVDAGAELGYVKWGPGGVPEHSTLIKHQQCGLLAHYLSGGRGNPSMDTVIAVHVLTHESMHMSGITDESLTDCAAMQRDATTARMMGATGGQALLLAKRYWVNVYPNMPDAYRNDACRPGGNLDEHLIDPPW